MKPEPTEIVDNMLAHVYRRDRIRRAERARHTAVLRERAQMRVDASRPAIGPRKSAGERVALALAAGLFGVVVACSVVAWMDFWEVWT